MKRYESVLNSDNIIQIDKLNNDIMSDYMYDPEELEKGIEIEMEHTSDREVAKVIAKQHLNELPDYYSRLEDMENEANDYWEDEWEETEPDIDLSSYEYEPYDPIVNDGYEELNIDAYQSYFPDFE